MCLNDTLCESNLGCSSDAGSDESAQVIAELGVCTPVAFNLSGSVGIVQRHSVLCSDCSNGRASCALFQDDAECFGVGMLLVFKAQGSWSPTAAAAGRWAGGGCVVSKLPYSQSEFDGDSNDGFIRMVYKGYCN
jgi:hypothetical protein